MFYDQFEVNAAKKFMATLDSKMATLGEAKGGHMAIPGQKNLQKPDYTINILEIPAKISRPRPNPAPGQIPAKKC